VAAPSDATTLIRSPAQELQESWQARVLRETCAMAGLGILSPKGKLGGVVLSVFAHGLDAGALSILLKAAFPDFYSIGAPFLCSAAKIDKSGRIVADAVLADNAAPARDHILFRCTRDMEAAFRRLADRCRLNDTDRLKLFTAAREWIVADRRLDPTMDPADPDAKRLTVH
jgi:hypothetical protein